MVPVIFGRGQDSGVRVPRMNVVSIVVFVASFTIGALAAKALNNPVPVIVMAIVGIILMQAPRIAEQWERAVVLRLGRFVGLRGPGLFWIVPFVDRVSTWIDQRTITTTFAAEQTLTSDTVPVNVDAVLFWMVHDAQKAALEVQDYSQAISWAAQTALRDIIGRTALTDLLRGRERIESELQEHSLLHEQRRVRPFLPQLPALDLRFRHVGQEPASAHGLLVILHFERRLLRVVHHPEQHRIDVHRDGVRRQRLLRRERRRNRALVDP